MKHTAKLPLNRRKPSGYLNVTGRHGKKGERTLSRRALRMAKLYLENKPGAVLDAQIKAAKKYLANFRASTRMIVNMRNEELAAIARTMEQAIRAFPPDYNLGMDKATETFIFEELGIGRAFDAIFGGERFKLIEENPFLPLSPSDCAFVHNTFVTKFRDLVTPFDDEPINRVVDVIKVFDKGLVPVNKFPVLGPSVVVEIDEKHTMFINYGGGRKAWDPSECKYIEGQVEVLKSGIAKSYNGYRMVMNLDGTIVKYANGGQIKTAATEETSRFLNDIADAGKERLEIGKKLEEIREYTVNSFLNGQIGNLSNNALKT